MTTLEFPKELNEFCKIEPSCHSPKQGVNIVSIESFEGIKKKGKKDTFSLWKVNWLRGDSKLNEFMGGISSSFPLTKCKLEAGKKLTKLMKSLEGRTFPITIVILRTQKNQIMPLDNGEYRMMPLDNSEIEQYCFLSDKEIIDRINTTKNTTENSTKNSMGDWFGKQPDNSSDELYENIVA